MKQPAKPFALCVANTDYKASLIPGKVYRIIPDPRAAKDDLVRILDESGEDYLYHKSHFLFVDFPRAALRAFFAWPRPGEDASDLVVINAHAEELNEEAQDALSYQIPL